MENFDACAATFSSFQPRMDYFFGKYLLFFSLLCVVFFFANSFLFTVCMIYETPSNIVSDYLPTFPLLPSSARYCLPSLRPKVNFPLFLTPAMSVLSVSITLLPQLNSQLPFMVKKLLEKRY